MAVHKLGSKADWCGLSAPELFTALGESRLEALLVPSGDVVSPERCVSGTSVGGRLLDSVGSLPTPVHASGTQLALFDPPQSRGPAVTRRAQ